MPFASLSPVRLMERRQNGIPAVQKFLPSSQNEGTSVNTWEEQRHAQSDTHLTQLMVEWAKDPSWGHSGTCLTSEKAWHRTEERQALSWTTPHSQPQGKPGLCSAGGEKIICFLIPFSSPWDSVTPKSLILEHGLRCSWEEDKAKNTTPAPAYGLIQPLNLSCSSGWLPCISPITSCWQKPQGLTKVVQA